MRPNKFSTRIIKGAIAHTNAPMILAAIALIVVLWLTMSIPPGLISWLASIPAFVMITLTGMARMKDITKTEWHWQLRRFGFLLVCLGSIGWIIGPAVDTRIDFPTWRTVTIAYGLAFTWFTTPDMPPWWPYIIGEKKLRKGKQP